MASEIIDILEEELIEAVGNLEIAEGEDDQEQLRLMILKLQLSAFERGMSVAPQGEAQMIQTSISDEDATELVKSLLKTGRFSLTVTVS